MKYEIGSPCMMGCNIVNGGYNFAYASSYAAMHSDTAVYVCIFKRNDTEPFYELELHKTMGIVYSIFITGINIDDCFYCFKENEEYIVDPYAKAVTECEIFGIEKKDTIHTSPVKLADYNWEDDRQLQTKANRYAPGYRHNEKADYKYFRT